MTTLDPPDPDENADLVAQEQYDVEAPSDPDDDVGPTARVQSDAEGRAAEAAREAKDEAFSVFYRGHFAKLVAFHLYLGAPRREAENLAQETMRRVYLKWDKLRQPMGWALRDASLTFGHWAFQTREEPSDSVLDDAPFHAGHGSDDWLDVHDLRAFLQTLPYRQRQVMAWTLLEYKPHEIAEILKTSADAVRGSLREARKKCREWWDQREEDQDEDPPGGEDR